MLNQLTKILAILFCACWAVFIFLEYWQYHGYQRDALALFQYGGLAAGLLLGGGAATVALLRWRDRAAPYVNGLSLTALACLLMVILMNALFQKNTGQGLTGGENITLIGTMLGTALAVYFVLAVCYAGGALLTDLFGLRLRTAEWRMVRLALGIMLVTFLLFGLGALNLLYVFLLFPLLGLLLFLHWRAALDFLGFTLWRPIPLHRDLNAVGVLSFFLLLLLVCMNFMGANRPYPFGFDSLTLYANLASLIQDYHGLVEGFSAYNWSLFISLGYLLFDEGAVTMGLSFAGGVLSLFALYHFSRRWLDTNFAFLVVLLFYTMPMINWLSYKDIKVDMGLLFFTFCLLFLFYNWASPPEAEPEPEPAPVRKQAPRPAKSKSRSARRRSPATQAKANPKPRGPSWIERTRQWLAGKGPAVLREHHLFVWMGVFAGFATGIKLSAVLALFGLIAALWYYRGGWVAFLGSFAFLFASALLAGLDTRAGLRYFNTSATTVTYVLLAAGAGVLLFLAVRKRAVLLDLLRDSALVSVFFALTLAPWLIKNYTETGRLDVNSLTQGRTEHPRPTLQELDRIWQAQQTTPNQ